MSEIKGATVFEYCEINGDFRQVQNENAEDPSTWSLTRDDDEQLTKEIRAIFAEEDDYDDDEVYDEDDPAATEPNYYWELKGIAHLPRTTTLEFKSGRGHLSAVLIDWGN